MVSSGHSRRASGIPRILVVENDSYYLDGCLALLTHWGYEHVIATGQGEALLADARWKARSHHCHVALVDMRLLDDLIPNTSGLDLIPELKPTISIVISNHDSSQTTKEARTKGAFDIISKSRPKEIQESLSAALRYACASQRGVRIDWPGDLQLTHVMQHFFPDDRTISSDQVDDVLSRLFVNSNSLRLWTFSHANHLPILAPQRRSLLLYIRADMLPREIIRLAKTERIEIEVGRYRDYIERKLPGGFYGHVQSKSMLESSLGASIDSVLWDVGAIKYEFEGVFVDRLIPFSVYYAEHPEKVIQTLRHLFEQVWKGVYLSTKQLQEQSLFATYSKVWGGEKWRERLEGFIDRQEHVWDVLGVEIASLLNPITWLKANKDRSDPPDTYTAITHGDMHGDNIFVDAQSGLAWVVGFKRSGYGPILQDFVELEVDILTRLIPFQDMPLAACYDLYRIIAAPKTLGDLFPSEKYLSHPEASKALSIVGELRKIASDIAGVRDAEQYLWGLLLNAVFRVTISPENDDLYARSWLLGSVICSRLEHWRDKWSLGPLPIGSPGPKSTTEIKKPFRVFLSSTWRDLQPEREAVEQALHRMRNTLFSGMEYFGSRPETSREASLGEVDDSDIYVGIFAHWYGSGITEAEYRRARERGIACLIYLKDDSMPVPPGDIEHDASAIAQLNGLKSELKASHIVSFFKDPHELAAHVVADLHNHLSRSQ